MKKLKGFLLLAFIVNGAAMVTYAVSKGVPLAAAFGALVAYFCYLLCRAVYLTLTTVEVD
jgi:hypothetical protein